MRQPKSQVLPTVVARPTFPGENKMASGNGAGNQTTCSIVNFLWLHNSQMMKTILLANSLVTKMGPGRASEDETQLTSVPL